MALRYRTAGTTMASALRRAAPQLKVASVSARAFSASVQRRADAYVAGEPSGPSIKTKLPGPAVTAGLKDLERVFDTRSASTLVDYEKSIGN